MRSKSNWVQRMILNYQGKFVKYSRQTMKIPSKPNYVMMQFSMPQEAKSPYFIPRSLDYATNI